MLLFAGSHAVISFNRPSWTWCIFNIKIVESKFSEPALAWQYLLHTHRLISFWLEQHFYSFCSKKCRKYSLSLSIFKRAPTKTTANNYLEVFTHKLSKHIKIVRLKCELGCKKIQLCRLSGKNEIIFRTTHFKGLNKCCDFKSKNYFYFRIMNGLFLSDYIFNRYNLIIQ